MVPLDRALVSSYRLSIVTMSLTEAVWPHFAVQVFGGAVSIPPVWGNGGGGRRTSTLVPRGSSQATIFASSDSFSIRFSV